MDQYTHPRHHHWILHVVIAALAFVMGWQATSLGLLSPLDNDIPVDDHSDVSTAKDTDLSLFWKVWEEVESKYVHIEDIDHDKMIYGAIKGMVESLDDPYTVFMDPAESDEFNASLDGTLEGIGAELTVEDNLLTVVSPLRDSPAEKAGLLPGDIVYKIDGEIASDMTLFDAIMNIRGEKGTAVVITVLREGLSGTVDISIVRDSIKVDSVTIEKLDGDITYISVNQFNDRTSEQFGKAIDSIILDEPNGMIVDLRFNGGGYLDIAVDLLSYVLPSEKDVVTLKQKDSEDDPMQTNGNPKVLSVPLVVLVNGGSASASEIFAGAIQDHKRGIVMGTQSFGKGTVQEVESFADGSSMRITIAKWFTAGGRDINKVGITPDILVESEKTDTPNGTDTQKEAAREYLMNL